MGSSQRLPRIMRAWGRMRNFIILKRICGLRLKANDLKGVHVKKKINLLCKSSSHIHLNVQIMLKVFVLIEYA